MNEEKDFSPEKLRKQLEEADIHPSHHRLRILQYLVKNRTHPTVDTIYKDISTEICTLSKTTIYNTLNLFLEKNLISAFTIGQHELLYDWNPQPHAHFRCTHCGSVYDVNIEPLSYEGKTVNGHRIVECHIHFKGICKDCLTSG